MRARYKVKQRPHLLLPSEASFVQFNYNVRDVELGPGGIPHQPELSVILRVEGVEYTLGTLSSTLTTPQVPPSGTADYLSKEFSIPQNLRGQVGELIFRLSFIPGQLAPVSGHATIWIDNVKLGPSGAPLQAESTAQLESATLQLTVGDLTSLIDASRAGWLSIVEMPDGSTGVTLRGFGGTTSELTVVNDRNEQEDGDAGFDEGGLDDQWLLANFDATSLFSTSMNQQTGGVGVGLLVGGLSYSALIADQSGGNGDPSLSPDGHTIQSQDDAFLLSREGTALPQTIVDCNGAIHSIVRVGGTLVDRGAIGVLDFDIRRDLASPGGNRAIADSEVLKLEKFTLGSLGAQDVLGRNGGRFIHGAPFIHSASYLGQSKANDESNQNTLQHSLSFGTLTLLPDRDSVNTVAGNGQWSMANGQLTGEQLDLLSRATVTIADLADGYLALTLGTTITLDTDAAGHGWFIDSTPFTSEEFLSSAISHQLSADSNGPAAGRMDLLTVLMHELGHVMGLGHVSSAVDGTRLMAGSIDPGIRRLPSSLDLGLTEPTSHVSPFTSDAPTIWVPYLAHYTITSSGEQQLAPVINPAHLVQAAQTPSHAGIFTEPVIK